MNEVPWTNNAEFDCQLGVNRGTLESYLQQFGFVVAD